MTDVDPPVKLTGVLVDIVADHEVNALVDAEPPEELLPPPAQALINIGKKTKVIFFIFHPFFVFITSL
jgi:hypothetical protein